MDEVRVYRDVLVGFCADVFCKHGLSPEDGRAAAEVLVAADARGIPSHGVGRLWRYVNGLKDGTMLPDVKPEIVRETQSSLVLNAKGSMGAPVSVHAMKSIIEKARKTGAAFGCVRDSNHYGIAGFYAMMALEHDMIGVSMTNTAALGVPTFGSEVVFGTNPFAFAAPADKEKAFVLDMSTTVVTRGKVEVYNRLNKPLPVGWAVYADGSHADNPAKILDDMFYRKGGGILPLGGAGEEFGGHKGYGLAVMVDILCAVLAGAPFGQDICDTETTSARVSHFFGAIKIESFREASSFRKDMDKMLYRLRNIPPIPSQKQVYFAGLKEFMAEEDSLKAGVKVMPKVYDELCGIGAECGVPAPQKVSL